MAPQRSVRDDDEGPSPEDIEAFGDATRSCPSCGTRLYDDVALCYKCGHAIGGGGKTDERPLPIWVMVVIGVVVLGLVAPWVLRIF